jgi:hypothetical protein
MCILSKTLNACLLHRLHDALRSLHHMQLHIIDCGFSVSSFTIESLSGVTILPEEIKYGNDAISLGAIKKLLAQFHIESVGIRNAVPRFEEGFIYIVQKDGEHFICIEKMRSQYFIFDPVCGLYKESLKNIHGYKLSGIMLKAAKNHGVAKKDKWHYYGRLNQGRASLDLTISKIKSVLG